MVTNISEKVHCCTSEVLLIIDRSQPNLHPSQRMRGEGYEFSKKSLEWEGDEARGSLSKFPLIIYQ